MTESFASARMAEGYANARPPVHPRIIERIGAYLGGRRSRALDLGCGAGLSTRPLPTICDECTGIDPVEAMVRVARNTAPAARFACSRAESLPFARGSFDLITAAGALNYADPARAFPEAARVLARGGILAVYDFSPGRTFREAGGLASWFAEFERRYPWPTGDAIDLSPEILGTVAVGFRVAAHERFEIGLTLAPEFYLEYVLTETNVSRAAEPVLEIRQWCAATLDPVFGGNPREVLFRGYIAYLHV